MYVCRVKSTQRRLLEGFSCLLTGFNSESDYKGRLTTTHPCYLQVAITRNAKLTLHQHGSSVKLKAKKKMLSVKTRNQANGTCLIFLIVITDLEQNNIVIPLDDFSL